MRMVEEHGTPNLDQQVKAGLLAGLEDALEHLRAVSMRQVPHQEGVLQNTAAVSVEVSPGSMRGAVSYDTPYAARQHEETSWEHKNGRKAKYLEDPMNSERATMARAIAARAVFD